MNTQRGKAAAGMMTTPAVRWSEYCKATVLYAETRFQGRVVGRRPTMQELMAVESFCPAGKFNRIECWPPAGVPLWQYNPPRYPAAQTTA